MLFPCCSFVVILFVARSYGQLSLSVAKGDKSVTHTHQVYKSYRIPDGQLSGWLTKSEISCIHKPYMSLKILKYPASYITVESEDKAYPEISIADDLWSAKILRGQTKGSLLVNVKMLCKKLYDGQSPKAEYTREMAITDLKPVEFEE